MIKVLNLFAGLGGNRKYWDEVAREKGISIEVTAVEFDPEIAKAYAKRYPNDNVIVGDAWGYAAKNYLDFDFIWASPPCQSHSRLNFCNNSRNEATRVLPDFRLYELISYLKTFCKKAFVVENVVPYYEPLIKPTAEIGRHYFWANLDLFFLSNDKFRIIEKVKIGDFKDLDLSEFNITNKRQAIRNEVDYEIGKKIFERYLESR
ncbi:DNA cytosine methyltransferase [Campylobacter concisus]|uniref:DNA cytosine methyltransferase n=1 Tax=Campylobacter concisus TaxID=199 RepID=UPI001CA37FDB|nr:DNA cytosine methyltransferase [Campylobacter concisus]